MAAEEAEPDEVTVQSLLVRVVRVAAAQDRRGPLAQQERMDLEEEGVVEGTPTDSTAAQAARVSS
jgi:hypothetical protein